MAWFVTRIVSVTALQIWRQKMSKKHVLFDFTQSENRKNNRKTFEGASVEPTKIGFTFAKILESLDSPRTAKVKYSNITHI